jgi:hypothetical protein
MTRGAIERSAPLRSLTTAEVLQGKQKAVFSSTRGRRNDLPASTCGAIRKIGILIDGIEGWLASGLPLEIPNSRVI